MKFKNPGKLFSHYSGRYKYWEEYEIDLQHSSPIAIVIPAFYEKKLSETLESLNNCVPIDPIPNVIIVLNHPNTASKAIKEFHEKQYKSLLTQMRALNNINLSVIRAFNVKSKAEGVGSARKIGMDQALRNFCRKAMDGMIICLDGDCLVEKNYLQAWQATERNNCLTATAAYTHQSDSSADLNNGILHYELSLRIYRMGLKWCGFPHAYDTIGSCMGVRASLYAKVGGMNRRTAGEDFYFLHKCFLHEDVCEMKKGYVYPSARISERVPFGTGRAQQEWVKNKKHTSYYHIDCWTIMKSFLQQIPAIWKSVETIRYPDELSGYVDAVEFRLRMDEMRHKSNDYQTFRKHFFQWCDGFRMMKYLHHLRDNIYGEQEINRVATEMLENIDRKPSATSVLALNEKYVEIQYG